MKTILDPTDRAEVLQRIRRVEPDSDRRWGSMTAHQMVCHVADGFPAMRGDRPDDPRSNLFTRTLLRLFALTLPVTWPKGVMTFPEIDQEVGGTPPDVFQADVERLEAEMDTFLENLNPSTFRHPIFGRLSRGEWGRWGYRHMDHHARQFGL